MIEIRKNSAMKKNITGNPLSRTAIVQKVCFPILVLMWKFVLSIEQNVLKLKNLSYQLTLVFNPEKRCSVGNTEFLWSNLLGENATIVEVGAFDGRDTIKFASEFPLGRVFAFEPDIELFVDATNNASGFPNVTVYPYAVSNTTEIQSFFKSYGSSRASGSLRKPTEHLRIHPSVQFELENQVPTISIDLNSFLKDKVNQIDLLWIDAQGHEMSVLEGASAFLKNTKYIFCEVSNTRLYEGAALFSEIEEYLKASDFILIDSDISFQSKDGSGNALFRKSHSSTNPESANSLGSI